MEGKVTISVDDFERLRKYERVIDEVYKSLSKCGFTDDGNSVNAEPVLEAISALASL